MYTFDISGNPGLIWYMKFQTDLSWRKAKVVFILCEVIQIFKIQTI